MRAHQLDANGVIINTIIVDTLDILPNLVDADAIHGNIGDSIINGVLIPQEVIPEPAIVPNRIDRLSARLTLLKVGKWHLIQPAIDTMQEPQKSVAQAYFEDAHYWNRHDTFVLLLAPALGLGESDLDSLFIAAQALQDSLKP